MDVFFKAKRTEVMRAIRSKNTKPELAIRSALHRLGYRFRLHVDNLPGKPDVVLPRYQTAIQIRGCFWHGHSCADGHIPKTRREYWGPKLLKNKERDKKNDAAIRRLGWSLVTVWECHCLDTRNLRKTISRIVRHLEANS